MKSIVIIENFGKKMDTVLGYIDGNLLYKQCNVDFRNNVYLSLLKDVAKENKISLNVLESDWAFQNELEVPDNLKKYQKAKKDFYSNFSLINYLNDFQNKLKVEDENTLHQYLGELEIFLYNVFMASGGEQNIDKFLIWLDMFNKENSVPYKDIKQKTHEGKKVDLKKFKEDMDTYIRTLIEAEKPRQIDLVAALL